MGLYISLIVFFHNQSMAIQYLNKTISEDVTFIKAPSVSIGILYQMLDLKIFQIKLLSHNVYTIRFSMSVTSMRDIINSVVHPRLIGCPSTVNPLSPNFPKCNHIIFFFKKTEPVSIACRKGYKEGVYWGLVAGMCQENQTNNYGNI